MTRSKPIFFARKFEAVVNHEVINEVEKYISGDNDKCRCNVYYLYEMISFQKKCGRGNCLIPIVFLSISYNSNNV